MKEKLEQVLADLKAIGISVAKVESDLGFSNGLLGKAKNGKANLSDEKFNLLINYYEKNFNSNEAEEESTFEPIKEQKDVVEFVKPKPEIQLPKVSGVMVGGEILKNTPKTLFQLMLAEFNDLVLEQPPVSQVKAKLLDILKRAEQPEFTFRQVEAIRERCINYLNGTYGVSVKKESYNNNK